MRAVQIWLFGLFLIKGIAVLADTQSRVRFFPYFFVSQEKPSNIQAAYYFVSADVVSDGVTEGAGFYADLTGHYAHGVPFFSNLNLRDLYFQNERLFVGRRRFHWSFSDQAWKLGWIEPQFRSQSFLPERQGLSGVFYEIPFALGSLPSQLTLFVSMLNFPDQGPGYLIEQGRFRAQNPWFDLPPAQAYISNTGVTDDILYDILVPSLDRILVQSSFGWHGRIGDLQQDPHVWQASFFSKTSPSLNMAAQAYAKPDNSIFVEIHPMIQRHRVLNLEYQMRIHRHWLTQVGYLNESIDPANPIPQLTWASRAQRSLGHLRFAYEGKKYGMALMGLWPLRTTAIDVVGPQSTELSAILTRQLSPAQEQFQWEGYWTMAFDDKKDWVQKWIYRLAPQDQFELLTHHSQFHFHPRWSLWAAWEFFKAKQASSFFARYDQMDWVQIGVEHVF